MAKKRKTTGRSSSVNVQAGRGGDGWGVAAVAGGVGLVGTALYYYLKSGPGSEQDSPLTPDVIEKPLDAIVDALDHKFGKRWADIAVSVLERALEAALPPEVVSLVRIVHKAEVLVNEGKIAASEKKQWAEKRLDEQRRNRMQ